MKKIIDYLFYRYYMVCIKNEESPCFGATCILAEVVTMAYLFIVLIPVPADVSGAVIRTGVPERSGRGQAGRKLPLHLFTA